MKQLFTAFFFALSSLACGQTFNWVPQTSGVTTGLNDVFFVDNQTGWAVGANGVILNTSDGGSTWSAQNSGKPDAMRAVYFINPDTGWVIGKDIFNILLKTIDGGATWSDITSPNISTGTIQDVAFANENDGWLVTSDSIFESKDGGISWTSQSVNTSVSQTAFRALAIAFNPINGLGTGYVGGRSKRSGIPSAHADIFAEALSSSLPSDYQSGSGSFKTNDLNINCIAFASQTIGFAGGTQGTIYKLDGFEGLSNTGPWEINFDLNPTTSQGIKGISFPTASNGMFMTSTTGTSINTLIFHTADTGNTWTTTPDTIPGLIHESLHAPDANTPWIVGVNGAIYKGTAISSGIKDVESPILTNVFPNPTSGLVTVELNNEVKGEVNYMLLDITGRQTLEGTWQKHIGNQRFKIDMRDLVTGIYMLRVTTSNGQNQIFRVAKN